MAVADPDPNRSYEERAIADGRRGDWDAAIHELDTAIRSHPDVADLYYLRAAAYVELIRADASQTALNDDGKNAADYHHAAASLQRATEDLHKYIELEPDPTLRAAIESSLHVYSERAQALESRASAVEQRDADRAREQEQARRERELAEENDRVQAAVAERRRVQADYDAAAGRAQTRRHAGWILLGLGGVLGGAAGCAAYLGDQQTNKILSGGLGSPGDIDSAASTGRALNVTAYVLGGGAALGMVIGLPLVLFNGDPAQPHVAASIRANGFGLYGVF